jgi:large subunit ribosomal protein L30
MGRKLRITQTRSTIGRVKNQKQTMRALGIRRMGGSVVHEDTPPVRGMVAKVRHLVDVEELDGDTQ